MNFRRIHTGDAYIIAAEGGYVKHYAEQDGFLISSEPVDIFVSDFAVRSMHDEVRSDAIQAMNERGLVADEVLR